MDYHHETQPLPNPLSWFFHHLPRPLHRIEVIGNFGAQLVLPFGLFLPQPFASYAGILMVLTQLYLVVSGNYAWLNWATIFAIVAGIGDPFPMGGSFGGTPLWFEIVVVALAVVIVVLSYWPVRNMASPRQAMNASFNPLHLVNTYGAFGSVERRRYEVIVEGTDAEELTPTTVWREYAFKAKPGDPKRIPPPVAPYHLRLDWLMWFLPISPVYGSDWFVPFLARLLVNDEPTLRLMGPNPFPEAPPVHVRARLFHYRFTTWRELRETGAWWVRTPVGDFAGPIRLETRAR